LANVLAGSLVMANESGVGQIKVYDWLKYAI